MKSCANLTLAFYTPAKYRLIWRHRRRFGWRPWRRCAYLTSGQASVSQPQLVFSDFVTEHWILVLRIQQTEYIERCHYKRWCTLGNNVSNGKYFPIAFLFYLNLILIFLKGLIHIAETVGLSLLAPRKKISVLLIGNHSAGKSSFINWSVVCLHIYVAHHVGL